MIKPVVLTTGDPSGIGPEIALKAWNKIGQDVPFFLLGDPEKLAPLAATTGTVINQIETPDQAMNASAGLPVLPHRFPASIVPGQPDPRNAQTIVDMIARAVAFVQSGDASALTTNPINKKALYDGAGFSFPGHTEFLADLAGIAHPVMMLCSDILRVVPTTIHIPLSDVPNTLTAELLETTIRVTHDALQRDFGINAPRIAVAGLNPHAGEGGKMGRDEITLINPVLEKLRNQGMSINGPLSADTMFHAAARATYDVAVCMYHDQALIPIKTLDFSGGVNTTLGLPFIRTSPDHGTAYDIAGQNLAEPDSLIAALRLAHKLAMAKG